MESAQKEHEEKRRMGLGLELSKDAPRPTADLVQELKAESETHRRQAAALLEERQQLKAMRVARPEVASHPDLTDLFEHAPVGYVVLDRGGLIKRANATFAELLGRRQAKLPGQSFAALAAPGSGLAVLAHLQQAFRTEERQTCKLTLLKFPTDEFYARLSTVRRGALLRTAVMDISDIQVSEARIAEAELRFKMVTRATDDIIWDWDLRSNRVWQSDNIRRFGYNPKQVALETDWWPHHIHPEDRESTLRSLRGAIENKASSWSAEYRLLCQNGPPIFAFDRGYLIFDEKGTPVRMIGALTDHTLHKQAEIALAQEADRYRSLLRSAPDSIIVSSESGGIKLFNEETEKAFGYTPEELVGKSVEGLIPGSGPERYGHRKDGTEFPVEITVSQFQSAEGLLTTRAIRDVTEQKALGDALRASSKALESANAELDNFAHIASHELKEPLRMVKFFVDLLRKKYQGRLDADADEYIKFAFDGACRLSKLVDDLLIYARGGGEKPPLWPTDLNGALDVAKINLRAMIEETGAEISAPPLPTVNADFAQIVRVFQNLLCNSMKFRGASKPRIEIAAAREDGAWHFSIKDNGIGFEPGQTKEMFQIFRRLQRDTSSGSGIGLAACKKIIEIHGGKIWAESEPGGGATFHFTLPASGEPK